MKRWLAVIFSVCLVSLTAQSIAAMEEEGDYCECGMDEMGECLPCDEEME